jgi:hypothetical protein
MLQAVRYAAAVVEGCGGQKIRAEGSDIWRIDVFCGERAYLPLCLMFMASGIVKADKLRNAAFLLLHHYSGLGEVRWIEVMQT